MKLRDDEWFYSILDVALTWAFSRPKWARRHVREAVNAAMYAERADLTYHANEVLAILA